MHVFLRIVEEIKNEKKMHSFLFSFLDISENTENQKRKAVFSPLNETCNDFIQRNGNFTFFILFLILIFVFHFIYFFWQRDVDVSEYSWTYAYPPHPPSRLYLGRSVMDYNNDS